MDERQVASELVKLAKEMVSKGMVHSLKDFIKENEEEIESSGFDAKLKLSGPNSDSAHINITLKQLKAIAKIVK